ncbi:MAG: ORF6N domain-containing protein [Pseudomonadota bacterium]
MKLPDFTTLEEKAEAVTAFNLRGRVVLLARDVAEQFGVPTGQLHQNLARNPEKFTEDYGFKLEEDEFQKVIGLMAAKGEVQALGDLSKPPWVLTEKGVLMAATVLRTPQAVAATMKMIDVYLAAEDLGAEIEAAIKR